MAVNTAALKTFAPAMRRQLMEAVGRKLDLLLNSQTPDTLSTYAKQIAELRDQQEKSREQLLERVAYTWFNRLCALRYLDAKGWHPFGCKVLMPADGRETQPELLKLMRSGSLPGDLKTFTNEQRLNQLLDGQIPTAIPGGDAQGEVYRELVLAACRSYHNLLPDLFEGLDDASELLLPDDLLTEGSIAGSFRSSISDSDCDDVEIIGWLYQFYISEKKDEVIGKVVKSEDIPAATQLFTPNWIVKYMVQNTIGAQWLATYPDSPLREQMEFYIEPAEQTDEVKAKLAEITPTSLNPEELTLMDPACGSGHILVEAYEIFKAIYLEQGYQLREIPKLIFEKNLFGLDIDQRAIQLSIFCLLMKGREDDRKLLERSIALNITTLQESIDLEEEGLIQHMNLASYGLNGNDIRELKQLFEHASTFGSLIQIPDTLASKLPIPSEAKSDDLVLSNQIKLLRALSQQARLLASKYDAVVANPPYLGRKYQKQILKNYLRSNFKGMEKDTFSAFIHRGLLLSKEHSKIACVTPFTWLSLSSYEALRSMIIDNFSISSLVKPSYTSFFESAIVPLVSLVIDKYSNAIKGSFFDLGYLGSSKAQPQLLKAGIEDPNCTYKYTATSSGFSKIPGQAIAYQISDNELAAFATGIPFETIGHPKVGMQTSNNAKFLRLWFEISYSELTDKKTYQNKWIKYLKGGGYRRWNGNIEYLLHYNNDPEFILQQPNAQVMPLDTLTKRKGTWGSVTSSNFSCRAAPVDTFHDIGGHCFYPDEGYYFPLLGYLNSKIADRLLDAINPTLNFQVGDIAKLPIVAFNPSTDDLVNQLVDHSGTDWNSYERSWDFKVNPILQASPDPRNIESQYNFWITQNKEKIAVMKHLEETNNRFFIDAYGLTEELTPDVPIEQITLTVNPSYRYGGDGSDEEKWQRFQRDSMAELLSYATGCMMGRYSLDHPGLILADSRSNQDEQLAAYEAKIGKPIGDIHFKPDADAIIPVLDGEWFEDDIVARTREFLKVTFAESSVAENLRFIEDSIGKDIRKYFCKEFYKDHLQTYKKRPIYWMVQSPKAGFACLIYLHRYTPDTLLQVLNNYFRPYLQKLEARQEQLERDQSNDALPKREQTAARKEAEKITKVLKECQVWEQDALLPLAQQRIELDLDDGVKVNYLKLQEVLAKIPGLAAKGD